MPNPSPQIHYLKVDEQSLCQSAKYLITAMRGARDVGTLHYSQSNDSALTRLVLSREQKAETPFT
jgi:hypothetical protein